MAFNLNSQNKYQIFEIYNIQHGNDDMLSDIGNVGQEVRHGMWAYTPCNVSENVGIIRRNLFSFINEKRKYPTKPIKKILHLLKYYHECIQNLREILNKSDNKKQIIENIFELQSYLKSQNVLNDNYILYEEHNHKKKFKNLFTSRSIYELEKQYIDDVANFVYDYLNLGKPKYVGGGSFGYAYEINDNNILKFTNDISEVDAAVTISVNNVNFLAKVYSVYKIIDNEKNIEFFAIKQDNIKDKPKKKFIEYRNIIDKIQPSGMDFIDILIKMKKKPNNLFDELLEQIYPIISKETITDINLNDRVQAYDFLIGLFNIKKELTDLGIKSNDYSNLDNLGYKNGILTFFDVGSYVAAEPKIDNVIHISEDNIDINEVYDRNIAIDIANQIALKLNLNKPKVLGGGQFGIAFDIGNNEILKITKDNSEATENQKLIGKPLKYIAQPYKVFKITPQNNKNIPDTYGIILEKLNTNPEIKKSYEKLNYVFENFFDTNITDVVEHYLGYWNNEMIDKNKINAYLKKNPQDGKFFISLLNIANEVNYYGVTSVDYFNVDNLGYKKNGVLGFFDVGFGDGFLQPQGIENVEITEDGGAKFSTDNSIGHDDFPLYNNIDTSPSIQNDLNANSHLYNEDLEYNHVSDATKDEFIVTERKLSAMKGSTAVDVKKKCRLGGLGNTSAACNQGDINNLKFSSIDEELDNYTLNRGVGKDEMMFVKDFPLKHLRVSKRGIAGAIQDIRQGRPSQTNEPVIVFYNIKNQQFLVDDGYHRVAQAYLDKVKAIPVNIYSDMWSDYVANISDDNQFKLNEISTGEKYYRAVEKNMGKIVEFEPEGYYEAIDDYGDPIYKFNTFWVSDKPEIAASKSIGGAVMGLYSMFMQYGKKPEIFYIYEINEKPDVDISHWEIDDFAYLQEVRYRRPVRGKYKGKVLITDDIIKKLRAFYEIAGLDAYDEPDEEYMEIVKNTDYDKFLGSIKNMVNENVKINLPGKLSGYNSFEIINDGQVVGSVSIVDRGVHGNNHYITIDKITIDKNFRGSGYANDAMKILFEYANNSNLIITLTPDNVWGVSVPKLKA